MLANNSFCYGALKHLKNLVHLGILNTYKKA